MKSIPTLAALVTCALVLCVSCDEQSYIPSPGDNTFSQDSIIYAPDPDISMVNIPAEAITVDSARAICAALESGKTTTEKYYVKGWIAGLQDGNESAIANYGNAQFIMVDNRTRYKNRNIIAYQVLGKNGRKITNAEMVQVDDYVVVYGPLTNYNGTYETAGKGAAYIYSSSNPAFNVQDPEPTPDPEGFEVPEGTLNVYQACDIGEALGSGKTTSEAYYIKGYIRRFDEKYHESGIATYGNATFYIAATNNPDTPVSREFEAFQVYGKDKKKITDASTMAVGDFVVIYGKITNYNGTIETEGQGKAYIYNSNNPNW